MYENMGQTIAKLRRDRNLTQEKLAEQLSVSAQAVSKWEKRSLADDWPWWAVPGNGTVRAEMEADPRWQAWVDSLA